MAGFHQRWDTPGMYDGTSYPVQIAVCHTTVIPSFTVLQLPARPAPPERRRDTCPDYSATRGTVTAASTFWTRADQLVSPHGYGSGRSLPGP